MTKQMLKTALIELMETKPLSALTVTDLCSLADVNRSTFYSYYNDIYGLLNEIEEDMINQVPVGAVSNQPVGLNDRLIDDFTAFFGYVRHHAREFNILLQGGNHSFKERLMDNVMQHFRDNLKHSENPLLTRWVYIYAMNGVIGLVRDWMDRDFPVSDREFARIILQMSFRASEQKNTQASATRLSAIEKGEV